MIDSEVEQTITQSLIPIRWPDEAAEYARDKVRTFSISVTVLAKDAERIGADIEEFMENQLNTTPGYCGSISFKDEEV